MTVSRLKLMSKLVEIALCLSAVLLCGCNAPTGTLFYGAVGRGRNVVVIASAKRADDVGTNAVISYDIDGTYLERLADLTASSMKPRGIAPLDVFNFVVSLDGATRILSKNSIFGNFQILVPDSSFTGSVSQIARYESADLYFAIVGDSIDAFTSAGAKISGSSNPVIATTTGSCILSSPKGLFIDSENKRLFVTNGAAPWLLVYDLSTPSAPTCQSTNNALAGTVPTGLIKHSNGFLYVVSGVLPANNVKLWALAGDGTGAATAVYTDASGTVLNASTAIVEMPDKTVLIANSGTAQIDRFEVDGAAIAVRVGGAAFIKDTFTSLVNAIYVMRGK